MTHELTIKVKIGLFKALMISSLPNIERFRFDHDKNKLTFSGLMINRNKTEGLWIGKLRHSKDKVENIKWTNKPIKSLGIYYGHNYIECEKLNWEKKD
jgi:hypothetical protein